MKDWMEWLPPSTCFTGMEIIAGLGAASSAGGTLMGAMGQGQQSGATAAEARYRAQVAENNRQIAEQNARYAVQAGRTNAQAQDFQTRAQIGQATAAQGASGIDVATGSPVEVRSSIQQLGRLKTLEEIQKADLEAYGYRAKAADFQAESGLQGMKAASAERAKGPAMLGTILGGAGSLATKWGRWQDPFGSSRSAGALSDGDW